MPKRSDDFKAGRRDEILAAAMRLFVAEGYDRTTMRAIAREAGVSTGAIYVYFPTKAAILQAVCLEQSARERADLQEVIARLAPGDNPILAGLTATIERYIVAAPEERRQRERINLMVMYEATRDPDFAAGMREIIGSWRALVSSLIESQQAAGRIRADIDVAALAEVLIALPNGLEIAELLGGGRTDWRAIVQTLADVLWRGLAPGAESDGAAARGGLAVVAGAGAG